MDTSFAETLMRHKAEREAAEARQAKIHALIAVVMIAVAVAVMALARWA